MRDKIVDLWQTSARIQGLMALAAVGVVCYLAVVGRPVSGILAALVGIIVGFDFGTMKRQEE